MKNLFHRLFGRKAPAETVQRPQPPALPAERKVQKEEVPTPEEEIAGAEDLIRGLKHPEDVAQCQKMLAEKRARLAKGKEK